MADHSAIEWTEATWNPTSGCTQQGQRIHIVSAWRHFLLFGFQRYYVVLVPGAGLPEGIPITIDVNSDGIPDRRVFEPIVQ